MNLVELDHALRKLRLSGMADVLETRLRQAQTERMVPIDFLSALVSDELDQFESELRQSASAQWSLGLGLEAGWRGRFAVWEAKNGHRGGGVYFDPSLAVFAASRAAVAACSSCACCPGLLLNLASFSARAFCSAARAAFVSSSS